ncbi:hypothetical protein TGAM01_v208254 [Trichoderma gamsii]|uniref:Uncharacterized protein n=1 Tax=Trichoderma gamsii TaxID=398673 RepID=A0A2P4ZFD6_9HYPO|nr:hypothetical protein TGAM01_v208254 [Trichoderma gamsii]PON22999.1 hypothetical protein TGAM01_v208254 [Trichoderma gamsii]
MVMLISTAKEHWLLDNIQLVNCTAGHFPTKCPAFRPRGLAENARLRPALFRRTVPSQWPIIVKAMVTRIYHRSQLSARAINGQALNNAWGDMNSQERSRSRVK